MRDSMKVLIGFSCIWGTFALFGILFSSFTWGETNSGFPQVMLLLYALSFLPLSLLAIWCRKPAAIAFSVLAAMTAAGFVDAIIKSKHSDEITYHFTGADIFEAFVAGIPALVSVLLFRHQETHHAS